LSNKSIGHIIFIKDIIKIKKIMEEFKTKKQVVAKILQIKSKNTYTEKDKLLIQKLQQKLDEL
tara:strand:- start:173 stop:361 length:189 start_codon:yes stop_codon:yes gene_type:complete